MTDEKRFYEAPSQGERRSAPAAIRNRDFISDVLAEWLPPSGLVLEIASGTGEHVVHFADRFPALGWQPSDIHPDALQSTEAWRTSVMLPNILPPILLDASSPVWPIDQAAAVLSINMVHISPWASALGLLDGAARILPVGAPLIMYGPWLKDDIVTVRSNADFDADLKRRDPEWGIRRVEDFAEAAAVRGLGLETTRNMPANNLMLLLKRG